MTQRTSPDLLVLHALRCIGQSSADRVADATGLPRSRVETELAGLARSALVEGTSGPFGGWHLTDAGRAEDAARIADELDAADARGTVTEAFDAFLILNPELLELCTAWQMRPIGGSMMPNDHTDATYDRRVLDRLAGVHRRAVPVIAGLGAAILRFELYRLRLADALERAQAGEFDLVADSFGSYHMVWFQLHEDLLVTLGLDRG